MITKETLQTRRVALENDLLRVERVAEAHKIRVGQLQGAILEIDDLLQGLSTDGSPVVSGVVSPEGMKEG